jgi:carboxyl-terminal processing protease
MSSVRKSWSKVIRKIGAVLSISIAAMLMSASAGDPFETSKQLEIFTAVLREVQTQYVDDISAEQAVGTAIKGMLKSLDPYTVYYPEDQIEDVRLLQTGEYGGVGCVIQKVDGAIMISEVNDQGPAFTAGLRVGDVLTKVGDTDLNGKSISDVSTLLKGTPGTEVVLHVDRFGEAPMTLTFNRAKISKDAVPYYGIRDDGVGYVYLESFTDKASRQVKEALLDLKKQNPKGIILDLRGNGGGLLMEAVKIISFFSDTQDTLVSTRGKGGAIQDVYKKSAKTIFPDLPVAVLIDGGSASASEIVAGAMQDLDRGVILGQKSFGKGLVQQVHPLPFGAQMKVTIAKYYTPSGRCIQKINYDRDENGKRMAKSAQHTFQTKGGREVIDGDGVHPDSTLSEGFYPEFVAALASEGLDLKFAGRALLGLDPAEDAVTFEVSDELWEAFTTFLGEADFDYESGSERALEELAERASYLDYLEVEDLEQLRATIKERKGAVLDRDEEAIREFLADYLVQKNFSLRGSLERGMHKDTVVSQASQILLSPNTTAQLLSVR